MPGYTSDDLIIHWNYYFPLDRWWRLKYNKSLFSNDHLDANQYDISLEYLEEVLFEDYLEKGKKQEKIDREYKQGKWIIKPEENISSKQLDNLFDKIDITDINEQQKVEEK